MYSGSIKGIGPRYCPSIEDKIVKFSNKTRHQIFLEPEGLNDNTVYPKWYFYIFTSWCTGWNIE